MSKRMVLLQSQAFMADLFTVVMFALAGAAFSLAQYLVNRADDNRTVQPRRIVKTVAIGVLAGGIVAYRGKELSFNSLTTAMAVAVPLVSSIANEYLPPKWGGSDLHGRGKSSRNGSDGSNGSGSGTGGGGDGGNGDGDGDGDGVGVVSPPAHSSGFQFSETTHTSEPSADPRWRAEELIENADDRALTVAAFHFSGIESTWPPEQIRDALLSKDPVVVLHVFEEIGYPHGGR